MYVQTSDVKQKQQILKWKGFQNPITKFKHFSSIIIIFKDF